MSSSFWLKQEAKAQEVAEREAADKRQRLERWEDVEPDYCQLCASTKRTVLLGACTECFEAWRASRGLIRTDSTRADSCAQPTVRVESSKPERLAP